MIKQFINSAPSLLNHLRLSQGLNLAGIVTFAYQRIFVVASLLFMFRPAAAQPSLPNLSIVSSNDSVSVSWPQTGYYFILQSATDPFGAGDWTNVATASETVSSFSPSTPGGAALVVSNFEGEQISAAYATTNDQQFFRLKSPLFIPVCQFAVFYNGLLEFSTAATMVFNGPVHANGPIYVGASATAWDYFDETVTCSGTLSAPTNNGATIWGDPYTFSPDWRTTFNGNPGYITNVQALVLPIGTNDWHSILEMPPVGEDPNSSLWKARLCNRAEIVLLVSNTTVTLKIRTFTSINGQPALPGSDPSPIIVTNSILSARTNLPFLSVSNVFFDNRELKTNRVTEINIGRYASWLRTNSTVLTKYPSGSGIYPTVLYVADCRVVNSNEMTVVRITNGLVLPANGGQGFTLATPNPLYVLGNYNCTNATHLATTNTTDVAPAALMADALTILSYNWKDSTSFTAFSVSLAAWDASSATTVNAAILAGIVPSTGDRSLTFSGGVHNLPRLLQDWSNSHLWLNTSIACLFNSKSATNRFVNPITYFAPPTRHFSFDPNFRDPHKLPPGTPVVIVQPPDN